LLERAGALAARGEPFVLATVVRVERPASARRGDRALVLPDGGIQGWVGGACSEPIVVRESLRALSAGDPVVVRIGPRGRVLPDPEVVVAESMCASEGVVEVLIEPQLPQPLLAVLGSSPAARALRRLAPEVGWRVSESLDGADAVVVASMGHGDEDALTVALAGGAGYVGLVASAKRAGVVLAELRSQGVSDEALARVRSPAGLDLGPSSQEEIAVAVLAELIAWRHTRGSLPGHAPAEAVDPVCGMTVAVEGAKETAEWEGQTFYFCGAHCRKRFEADPARYASFTPS
jgi:xanthine dehydrogenase accessory factor